MSGARGRVLQTSSSPLAPATTAYTYDAGDRPTQITDSVGGNRFSVVVVWLFDHAPFSAAHHSRPMASNVF